MRLILVLAILFFIAALDMTVNAVTGGVHGWRDYTTLGGFWIGAIVFLWQWRNARSAGRK